MEISEMNGFVYIRGMNPQAIPKWVTSEVDDALVKTPYFMPNTLSVKKFFDEVYPLTNKHSYQNGVLDFLRTFQEPPGFVEQRIEAPKGIVLKDHQVTAVNIMLNRNKYGFFLGTGSGKTLIVLTFLLNLKDRINAIVFTPKRVINQYIGECKKYLKNTMVTEDPLDFIGEMGDRVLVTNYEQAKNVLEVLGPRKVGQLFLDESHYVKEYSSDRNQFMREFGQRAKRAYLFTGTPQDTNKHEIFPQLAVLDKRYMPGKTRFHSRYFHIDKYYKPQSIRKEVSDEIDAMLKEVTWGQETEDVVQLTDERNVIISIKKIPPEYQRLISDRIITKRSSNDPNVRWESVADTQGKLKQKLHQITGGTLKGHVRFEDDLENERTRKYTIRLKGSGKVNAIKALAKQVETAVIYTMYRAEVDVVGDALREVGATYRVIDGQTTDAKAREAEIGFKDGSIRFLVMQAKSGSAGLDLKNTQNVIFYSLPESYIVFTQCKGRIRRIGQTQVCQYFYLVAKGTVDEQILNSLKRKKSFSTRVFKIY